jgi:hypothetical protein
VAFGLNGQMKLMSMKLAILAGYAKNSLPCFYRIHLKEVFLFTFCQLATGMTQVKVPDT